jgi:hypothetical protein
MHLAVHSQSGRSALVVSCCLLGPSSGSCFAFGRRWLARCCFFFFFFLIDAGRWCVAPLAHIPVSSDAIDAGRWCVAPLAHILVSSAMTLAVGVLPLWLTSWCLLLRLSLAHVCLKCLRFACFGMHMPPFCFSFYIAVLELLVSHMHAASRDLTVQRSWFRPRCLLVLGLFMPQYAFGCSST